MTALVCVPRFSRPLCADSPSARCYPRQNTMGRALLLLVTTLSHTGSCEVRHIDFTFTPVVTHSCSGSVQWCLEELSAPQSTSSTLHCVPDCADSADNNRLVESTFPFSSLCLPSELGCCRLPAEPRNRRGMKPCLNGAHYAHLLKCAPTPYTVRASVQYTTIKRHLPVALRRKLSSRNRIRNKW